MTDRANEREETEVRMPVHWDTVVEMTRIHKITTLWFAAVLWLAMFSLWGIHHLGGERHLYSTQLLQISYLVVSATAVIASIFGVALWLWQYLIEMYWETRTQIENDETPAQ